MSFRIARALGSSSCPARSRSGLASFPDGFCIYHFQSRCPSKYQKRYKSSTTSSSRKVKPSTKNRTPYKPGGTGTSRSPTRGTAESVNSVPQPVKYRTFAETMALRSTPTVLYQAPPHTAYYVGSYSMGLFCLTYAGFNFYSHYLLPPEGLAPWVPIAFGGVCLFMTCFGTWLILAPARLVRTITAIPNPRVLPPSLVIQIRLRRMLALPFIKPRVIEVPPADLTLYERLYDQPMLGPGYAGQEDSAGRWSAPFRRFSAASRRVAWGLSKIWTRGGFVKMRVRDRRGGVYKLDRDGGWALDEGRGIDRLIRVKAS